VPSGGPWVKVRSTKANWGTAEAEKEQYEFWIRLGTNARRRDAPVTDNSRPDE